MLTQEQQNYQNAGGTLSNGQIPTQVAPTGQASYSSPISISSLQNPQAPISVPNAPIDSTNHAANVAGGSAMIAANNAIINPPVGTATSSNVTDIANRLSSMYSTPPSGADQFNTDYASSGIDAKQTAYNTDQAAVKTAQSKLAGINAQLAGLNAEAQAIPIQAQKDAEGRGVTAAGLSPLTTGQLRENALKALPLQAQALAAQAEVAAAQGNAQLSQSILQQAQDHLDKIYQIHQTDANNQYNYRKDLIDKAFTYASEVEKTRLADQKTQLATNHSDLADARNNAQSLANTAIQNGQANLASQLTSLTPPDINSKTFSSDLDKYNAKIAKIQGQIKPKAPASTESERSAAASSKFAAAFVPGAKLPDGTPVLDQNGYVTPVAWKQAIADAPRYGMTREQFIQQFGQHLFLDNGLPSSAYGLTPKEQKLITG